MILNAQSLRYYLQFTQLTKLNLKGVKHTGQINYVFKIICRQLN